MPPRKTPESQRQVQLWARAFEQRRKQTNVALKNLGLKPHDMTRWRNEGRRPQNQRIEALIRRCLAQHVWHGEAEVIDWLALLDISGHDTLRMLYAGQEGAQADKDIQAKIDGIISTNRWWRSPRHLPPETAGYIPRACEPQLIHALLNFSGFRQPEKRIVAVSAPTATGKTALLSRLVHSAELFERYRDGIYWINTADLTAPQAIRNLALATECITSLAEEDQLGFGAVQQRWQTWLSQPERVALVVFDDLSDTALFDTVMHGAGPQVRCLLSTRHRRVVASLLDQPAWQTVHEIQLTGLEATEIEVWQTDSGLSLDQSQQAQLAALRQQVEGRPGFIEAALLRSSKGEDLAGLLPTEQPESTQPGQAAGWPRPREIIERKLLVRQIEAARARHPDHPVVLQGAPGTGKSTVLNWLSSDPDWLQRYPDGMRLLTQAESTPALIQVHGQVDPVPASSAQILDRLQWQADQRILLLLDNWNDPELALNLARCLSSQSAIIVATRSSAVAASLTTGNDDLITVDGYTPEEVTTYFQLFCDLHQRAITPADHEYLETVCGLVRANPLGLRIALSLWLWRGWPKVIRQLAAQPPEQAGQAANDLYRPLRMAYDLLDSGLQRAFRQLSAVPLLGTYDQATFAALWAQLDPAYVDLYLDVLATDAGLIESTHEASHWKIHASVLSFARSLAADHGEDFLRREWVNRALASEAHRAAYRQFRDRSPKWTVRRWLELDQTARLQYHESAWRRSWYVLGKPAYVPEWAVAQAFAPNFSAAEYLIAQRLQTEEIRSHRLIQAVVLISVAAVLLGLLVIGHGEVNPWFAVDWLPRYAILMGVIILLDIALLFYIWLVGMSHKVIWLQWWLEIQSRRHTANAGAISGDTSTDQH